MIEICSKSDKKVSKTPKTVKSESATKPEGFQKQKNVPKLHKKGPKTCFWGEGARAEGVQIWLGGVQNLAGGVQNLRSGGGPGSGWGGPKMPLRGGPKTEILALRPRGMLKRRKCHFPPPQKHISPS